MNITTQSDNETERYRAVLTDLRRRLLADLAAIERALGMDTERTKQARQPQR